MYLLIVASLFAYLLATSGLLGTNGMSDGGGFS
jgi:hypothetical protein